MQQLKYMLSLMLVQGVKLVCPSDSDCYIHFFCGSLSVACYQDSIYIRYTKANTEWVLELPMLQANLHQTLESISYLICIYNICLHCLRTQKLYECSAPEQTFLSQIFKLSASAIGSRCLSFLKYFYEQSSASRRGCCTFWHVVFNIFLYMYIMCHQLIRCSIMKKWIYLGKRSFQLVQ